MSVPSIVPEEGPLYFVFCDYGPEIGQAYYEADPERSDRETIVDNLMYGQYVGARRVLEVDVVAGTSRDVTEEIFGEVEDRKERAFDNALSEANSPRF